MTSKPPREPKRERRKILQSKAVEDFYGTIENFLHKRCMTLNLSLLETFHVYIRRNQIFSRMKSNLCISILYFTDLYLSTFYKVE